MKRAIDYFDEFACSLLGQNFSSQYIDVAVGIKYYIKEHQLDDYQDPEMISRQELARFRGISPSDFVTFFSNYELRSKIEKIHRDCSSLALNRLKFETVITEEQCKKIFQEYYQLASDLASDSRYSSWLSEISDEISIDLRFAANMSDVVSEKVAMLFRT